VAVTIIIVVVVIIVIIIISFISGNVVHEEI